MGMSKTDEVQSVVVLNAVEDAVKALTDLRMAMGQMSLVGKNLTPEQAVVVDTVFTKSGMLLHHLGQFPSGPFDFVEVSS